MRGRQYLALHIFLILIFQSIVSLNENSYNIPKSLTSKSYIQSNGEPISHKGDSYYISPQPVIGKQTAILIFVQFSDVKNSTAIQTIMRTIYFPLRDYYNEVSYNRISIESSYPLGWVDLPHKMVYYGIDTVIGYADVNVISIFYDTVKIVDPYINFALYKYLIIVHAGDDQAVSWKAYDIWSSYYSDLRIPTDDGVTITNGLIVAETDPMGIVTHEFGHFLDLPDLYDVDRREDFVGSWSLMDSGGILGSPIGSCPSQLMSPERIWLGWIASNQIVSMPTTGFIKNVTLSSLEIPGDTLAAKIPLGGASYYAIEYRRKILFDKYLPMEGVIISYVDENLGSGQGVIRVQDGRPNTDSLDDAAFTSGMRFVDRKREVAVKVWALSETAFIQVQRGFADLKIEALDFTGSSILVGSVVFRVKLSNLGVTISNCAEVEIKIDGSTVARKELPPIPAFSSVTVDVGNWMSPAGSHEVEAFVDATDNVIEKDETNNSYLKTIIITRKVIVNQTLVSGHRVDVGSVQNVYLHAIWNDGTPVKGGVIYVNGTGLVTNSTGWIAISALFTTAGKRVWVITEVDCNDVTAYEKAVGDPYIIWDKINVKQQIDSLSPGRIQVTGTLNFESDGSATKKATVMVNGIKAEEISDGKYKAVLSTWSPTFTVNTQVETGGFKPLRKQITGYAIGNIAFQAPLVSIMVGALLYYIIKKRKPQWR